jgi:hypothetical protein
MQVNLKGCLGLYDVLLHFLEKINDLQEFFNIDVAIDGFHTVHHLLFDNCAQKVGDLREYVCC